MLLQRSTGEPRFIPMAAIDRIVGSAAANALLAGLLARARTGMGQRIEVPMFETMAQFVLSEHMQGATLRSAYWPGGYARTLSQHRRPYRTKDGFIAVLPYNDGQWRRFFEAIGKSHVVESDPRFADIAARTANIDALYAMLGEELKHRTTDEWLALLQKNDIPCVRPHTLETLMEDPHLDDIGFFRFEEHPSEGRIRTMREPSTWSETVPPTGRFAPRLGEHTREILGEAGYTSDEIDALLVQRAVMTDGANDLRQKGETMTYVCRWYRWNMRANLGRRWVPPARRARERSVPRGGQQSRVARVAFSQLLQLLENNTFDTRLRQMMIMRIGWVTGSAYEWTQHWRVATTANPPEDILAVRDWRNSDRLTPADKAILAATDECLGGKSISDAVWAEVTERVTDPGQQVEFIIAMGNWMSFSLLFRNLRHSAGGRSDGRPTVWRHRRLRVRYSALRHHDQQEGNDNARAPRHSAIGS